MVSTLQDANKESYSLIFYSYFLFFVSIVLLVLLLFMETTIFFSAFCELDKFVQSFRHH